MCKLAGLAQTHLAMGDAAMARLLDPAPPHDNDPLGSARAALALAQKWPRRMLINRAEKMWVLCAALEADPNNHQARFDLALAHHGAGVAALEALWDIVARQRDWRRT